MVPDGTHGWLKEIMVPSVNSDNVDQFSDPVRVADGQLQGLVVHRQVGDDAGGANGDGKFGMAEQVDKFASQLT